jgi:outer membrane protein TolC
MISQEAPFPGKRQLRGAMAGKEADSAFQEYLGVRLNVIARLKQAYHELHHAVEMASLINRNRDLLNGMIELTEARYSVGRAAQQDVFKGQTQLSIFDAQLARTEQDRRTAEIEINLLLNRPQAGHIEAPADLEPAPIPATLDELLARARNDAPMLLREQKNVERAQLGVNLARKDYYPDYVVSGGYFNQGGMAPMWEVRVDFKLPAYFWRKQRAGVAEQAASLSEARRNYEAADTSIQAKIREEFLAAETALKLVDLYRKSAIPQSQLALESSRASYETGAMDFLPVFSNFMNVVDYEMAYHEQVLRFHTAVARLEELTGTELLP